MFAIGDFTWPGLSKLTEEAGEVLQVVGKLMGSRGVTKHWDGKGDLRQRLLDELADVHAASAFVRDHMDLTDKEREAYIERVLAKRAMFEELACQGHSEGLGCPMTAPNKRPTVDPLAEILLEYAGLEGLGRTGAVVRELVADIRALRGVRNSLRAELADTRSGEKDALAIVADLRAELADVALMLDTERDLRAKADASYVEAMAKLGAELAAAKRDLEAATFFVIGDRHGSIEVTDCEGVGWAVWDQRVGPYQGCHCGNFDTRDAALARARELAAEKGEGGK